MNSRDYKVFRASYNYHIYNRGDNREKIFLDDEDYFNFLERLKIVMGLIPVPNLGQRGALRIRPLQKDSFNVIAYCLMPNHFHIVIRQNKDIPIGQLMTKVCTSYAKYFNHKYKRIGNIFQDTFKAKVIESDEYLFYLSAYIHNNPDQPFVYKYSSLSEYLLELKDSFCDTETVLKYFNENRQLYRDFVKGFTKIHQLMINDLVFEEE